MKYNQIISENIERMNLKKVRIKVDPAIVGISKDLSNCNGYEGYVLAEDEKSLKILVINPDLQGDTSVMNIPPEYLEKLANINDNLNALKVFIILALGVSADDPIIHQLAASESIDDVEVFLRDKGLTDEDIVDLYKYYIANE